MARKKIEIYDASLSLSINERELLKCLQDIERRLGGESVITTSLLMFVNTFHAWLKDWQNGKK